MCVFFLGGQIVNALLGTCSVTHLPEEGLGLGLG